MTSTALKTSLSKKHVLHDFKHFGQNNKQHFSDTAKLIVNAQTLLHKHHDQDIEMSEALRDFAEAKYQAAMNATKEVREGVVRQHCWEYFPQDPHTKNLAKLIKIKKKQQKQDGKRPVKIKDDHKYGKYFELLKSNPRSSLRHQMLAEGLDPSKLYLHPDTKIPPSPRRKSTCRPTWRSDGVRFL